MQDFNHFRAAKGVETDSTGRLHEMARIASIYTKLAETPTETKDRNLLIIAGEAFGDRLTNFNTYLQSCLMILNIHRVFQAVLKSDYIVVVVVVVVVVAVQCNS